MSETIIEFDLVCFVDEIEVAGRVSSDLYFAHLPGPARGRHRPAGAGRDRAEARRGSAAIEDHRSSTSPAAIEARAGRLNAPARAPKLVPLRRPKQERA